MEVVASLSQGRTAAAQCGLFTHKSVPVIFETPCIKKCLHFVGLHGSSCIIMHGVDHVHLSLLLVCFIFSVQCDLNLFVMNISTLDLSLQFVCL